MTARHTPPMGHIVLVGLMGSGKTTVGAALAAALGVPHRDSDRDIERQTGMTARALAARDGIDTLHDLEARHLLGALREPARTVISAAASTLDDPACRRALRGRANLVVWLRAEPGVLAARLGDDVLRPDLGGALDDVITRQAVERDRALREVADLTLDATAAPADIVAAIVANVRTVR
jgi:shikimate kinase